MSAHVQAKSNSENKVFFFGMVSEKKVSWRSKSKQLSLKPIPNSIQLGSAVFFTFPLLCLVLYS